MRTSPWGSSSCRQPSCLYSARRRPQPRGSKGLLSLAGLTAGFAAWTKNEGMLFVFAAVVALTAATLFKRGFRNSVRTLGLFLIGLIPVLLVIFYFKARYAPPNDLFGSHDLGPFLARLRDSHRYATYRQGLWERAAPMGKWSDGCLRHLPGREGSDIPAAASDLRFRGLYRACPDVHRAISLSTSLRLRT